MPSHSRTCLEHAPDGTMALRAQTLGVLERTGHATSTTVRVMMEMSAARETEADEHGHELWGEAAADALLVSQK